MVKRTGPHRVGVVVFDGVKLLDVAGPSEVFSEANRMGAKYELSVCSVGGTEVVSSTGLRISVDVDAAREDLRFDTLLVMGGDRLPTHPIPEPLVSAVRGLAGRSTRVCSICTGAFILAEAGLLSGRRATTHWQHTKLLGSAYSDIAVEPDAIFVRDRQTYTSAGVTAGIDLALALLEEDHGEDLARRVAQSLVVFLQRPGGQSQFSPTLQGPRPHTPVLRAVFDAVAADPAGEHSVPKLAALAAMSPRHLTRLFQEELGTTPARYVDAIRFDTAKAALEGGLTISEAAERAGYGNPESLRRTFIARLGVSPRAYQQRFRSAKRSDAALTS
ncbi:transcriptional regulator GlxA family with amidase domain [Kribbella orskensis]|uniref:Transcriptional regulator GlxA family with amidase domain n=1 Tax=Kribbella orskensis TaxID=2512216 RepID=A0ABY2BPL3_9ACTN|nr:MULTISPECIES: GlxA family transcriptional regulator [Kribbella]TCN39668.1 transcriptional regulator GlxA family with amidase domain [Kribbella sp. VKM Ac-2500]TCO27549.1 transcriptional regulator GlxA family with amidase domain [Kribbella orskensis]